MSENMEKELPLELRLDLLVDAELPESDRRELLLTLDREPRKWRDLSILFLQRQVERESVREMIGERAVSVAKPAGEETASHYFFPRLMTRSAGRAIAAGLLIAAISAVVTIYIVHHDSPGNFPSPLATGATESIDTHIPGEIVRSSGSWPVNVPMVRVQNVNEPFFPAGMQPGMETKRSVVIQPDGKGNAVVIPVNTLPMKFY